MILHIDIRGSSSQEKIQTRAFTNSTNYLLIKFPILYYDKDYDVSVTVYIYIYIFFIYIISIVVCLVSISSCLDYFLIFSLLLQFLDMDECKSDISDCDVNANCTNTDGSYKCKCKAGYAGDGHSCSGTYTFIFKDDPIYFASSGCFSYLFLLIVSK